MSIITLFQHIQKYENHSDNFITFFIIDFITFFIKDFITLPVNH